MEKKEKKEKKVKLTFEVSGLISQIVQPKAGVTERQLKDGLMRGVYKTTFNGTKIMDTVSRKYVATIHFSGPDDDFTWTLKNP